jgi:hypothetical protein
MGKGIEADRVTCISASHVPQVSGSWGGRAVIASKSKSLSQGGKIGNAKQIPPFSANQLITGFPAFFTLLYGG